MRAKIVVEVGNTRHDASSDLGNPITVLLKEAVKRGVNPAEALKFLAIIGCHVWHPEGAAGPQLNKVWSEYFGNPPRPQHNGSVIGTIEIPIMGERTRTETISGSDYYGNELLLAHHRGENAAHAFLFLASVGAVLHQPNASMLGGRERRGVIERFGTLD